MASIKKKEDTRKARKAGPKAAMARAKKSARKPAPKAAKKRAPKATKSPAPKKGVKAAVPKGKAPGASRRPRVARPRRRGLAVEERGPHAVPGLTDEDQIRAAKYLPRELPKRLFEEDRFLFPETYGVNRVRLLVRDPEWIFAYWDVSPSSMKDLG